MADSNDSKKIAQQRAKLDKIKKLFEEYTRIYEEDGLTEELNALNDAKTKMERIEEHLEKLKSGEVTPQNGSKESKSFEKQFTQLEEGLAKIAEAIEQGKATPKQLEKALNKYKKGLAKVIEKAEKQGGPSETDQQRIEDIQAKIQDLQQQIEGSTDDDTLVDKKEVRPDTVDVEQPSIEDEDKGEQPPKDLGEWRTRVDDHQKRLQEILAELGVTV